MLLAALLLTAAQAPGPVEPDLAGALAVLPRGGELSFLVVMEDRVESEVLFAETNGLRRSERAPYVRERLEAFATADQAALEAELVRLRAEGDVSFDHVLWIVNARWVKGTADAVAALAAVPGVERLHWDRPIPLEELEDAAPVAPLPAPPTSSAAAGEVNIVATQADQLWAIGVEGAGSFIINIDSGVNPNHPDLATSVWTNPGEIAGNLVDDDLNGFVDDTWGWDFQNNDNDPKDGDHGQKVAGILVGDGTNNGGVRTGMAPLGTMAVAQVAGEANLLAAYQYAITIGVDCITSSHSLKYPFFPDYHTIRRAMEAELAAGIVHSNSAGNEGGSLVTYPIPYNVAAPSHCPGPWTHPAQVSGGRSSVLAVAAIQLPGDVLYANSSQGPSAWEDVTLTQPAYPHVQDPALWDYPFAGGTQPGLLKPDLVGYAVVKTTAFGSTYTTGFGGTSAATPHVGGAFLLLLDANRNALPRQVSQALQETATDLGLPGKDLRHGAGKIQVYDAALRLFGLVTALPNDPAIGTTVSVDVSGPAGDPYVLGLGFAAGTTPTSLGFALEMAPPVYALIAGTLAGDANPLSFPIAIPNAPLLQGLSVYLQMVTDDTSGPTGQWLLSVLETVTIQ